MNTLKEIKQSVSFTASNPAKIPASTAPPRELIALTLVECCDIQIAHTMDNVIHVYIGPDDALKLVAKVFGPPDSPYITPCFIPKGSRLSVRSGAGEVSKGTLTANLISELWRV